MAISRESATTTSITAGRGGNWDRETYNNTMFIRGIVGYGAPPNCGYLEMVPTLNL